MEKIEKPSDINEVEQNLHYVEDELQNFEERQVNVTRTLQMIVYPAMVAFIILCAYGFFLIQSLTTDVHRLTETIAGMSQTVHTNMGSISGTMNTMNQQMSSLVDSTDQMTNNIVGMNTSTQDMAGNIQQMNASTQNMAVSTYNMQHDMWSMNKNISGPMKMFNKFSPFGNDKTTPYVVPPPAATATPYYNNYYGWQQPAVGVQVPAPVAQQQPQQPQPAAAVAVEPVAVPPADNAATVPATPTDAATAKDGRSAADTLQEPVLASATRG
ncbi:MAG: hypothetical protein PHE17_09860 [Thiothrix sp.]|jgi:uncharacterized protein YoxC|uniref:hypothetical protein n=1 Tax=Thiothrix sp. TaxID=1032 RepID=UPI00261E8A82|nr:hypothetical protein [Thiothrix sp.]MDD5393312.1 hypothetical protein [Thiothrix sp.]